MPELLSMAADVAGAAVAAGTPILLAGLGEIVAERAGVINLGLEGMMLVGAVSAFAGARATGDPWAGLALGIVAGALLSLVHAVLTVLLRANQIVAGLALTMLGAGLSGFLGAPLTGTTAPGITKVGIPLLEDIPLVGRAFFDHDPIAYAAFLLVPACWWLLFHTRLGLRVTAVGERPLAAETMGIGVTPVRFGAVLAGGALAGAGGAYLSLSVTGMWVQNMTAGQGWIAVALVVFARWNPWWAALGAYLFGGVTVFQLRLQAAGTTLPIHLLLMLPYLSTVVVLSIISWRGRRRGGGHGPAALGTPFHREDRTA
jgi:simple sugar transport system permease protein